jgi:DNA-binding NtrC family response regulator
VQINPRSDVGFRRVLIVEDDDHVRLATRAYLEKIGYKISVAANAVEALDILKREPQDLVICDMNLPDTSGLDLLKKIRSDYPDTVVVMITAFGTVETAVAAMKSGAYDYLIKPLHLYELRALVNRALERSRLIEEVSLLRRNIDEKYGFENIIGRSKALLHVLDQAARVAPTDATILIQGETGTGKEVMAKAIHFNSLRRSQPFVTINCGAIPRDLLESELFGHLRGAFTGAMAHKKGKVELADGGSLFLDEIGEMPLDLQVRLLRLIQEREIDKIGATQPLKVDVRIIAATHRDLQSLVATGHFREDLYYRLVVVPIEMPALRNRADDIPQFVHYFFEALKQKHGKKDLTFPETLMSYFTAYAWPGNVRELENTMERVVVLSQGDQITPNDLPEFLHTQQAPADSAKIPPQMEGMGLDRVEKELIVEALRKFNWNQTRAAQSLGISRKTLMYRMAKHGIGKHESKAGSAA